MLLLLLLLLSVSENTPVTIVVDYSINGLEKANIICTHYPETSAGRTKDLDLSI